MSNEGFKQAVLDALGVKFQPDQTKIGVLINKFNLNTKIINKNEIFNLNKDSSDSTIRKNITLSINKLLTIDPEDNDYTKKEEDREELEKELKSFSLDDLLKNSKGFEIGKGIHISNDLGYKHRNLKADKKNNKEKNNEEKKKLSLTHKELMPGKLDAYICNGILQNNNSLDIKRNDYIFVVDKNLDFEKQGKSEEEGGPSTAMEEAIRTLVGGKKNLTKTDPVFDITSGIYISVKCYQKGNKYKYGSLDGLNNFDFKNKHLKYELYNWERVLSNSELENELGNELGNPNLDNKKIFLCRRNENSGFVVKDEDGKLNLAKAKSYSFTDSGKHEEMNAVNGFTWEDVRREINKITVNQPFQFQTQTQTQTQTQNKLNIILYNKDKTGQILKIKDNNVTFTQDGKNDFIKYVDNTQLKDLQGLGLFSDFSKKMEHNTKTISYCNKDIVFNYILAKLVRKVGGLTNGATFLKRKKSVATYFNY